ncbi:MAG: plasmid pRiA4b ORF-3 family protein, partial [Marmoricola sp.]
PIWRRLDLRSDLTLDAVHQVLQTTYGWTDSHLHRFSIGGEPFDLAAEWFLCDYDAEEGEDDGTPDVEVHLDETLREPGDVVHYIYDYGDHWDLTIRLEEVLPLTKDAPLAGCVDGERAGPPDDCGSLRDAEDLADVLDDPAAFDPHELNEQLASPASGLIAWGVRRDLVALLNRLRHTPMGDDLLARTLALGNVEAPSPEMVVANLAGHQWFLDRAVDGIPLTTAGYLKPVDVEEACAVVPAVGEWIGKKNREDLTYPLLEFRQSLQKIGLLRKFKGNLLLTKAGKAAQQDPITLWRHVADSLIDRKAPAFEQQVRLLGLLCLASEPEGQHHKRLAEAMGYLGWRQNDGRSVSSENARWHLLELGEALSNVADSTRSRRERRNLTPAAVLLARAALSFPE